MPKITSDQLYPLIVTVALIAALTVLLVFRILTPDNQLVNTIFTAVITYWIFSSAAHQTANQLSNAQNNTPTLSAGSVHQEEHSNA